MKTFQQKRISWLKKGLMGIVLLLILAIAAFYIYSLDYYRASPEVDQLIAEEQDQMVFGDKEIKVKALDSGDDKIGLVFYPGGKVEAIAYLPLMDQLADEGLTCVLVEMPLNLAVFDSNAADQVLSSHPEIDQWFLAGHSLGGAMASKYAEENAWKFQGLILMGAYPINDADLPTLAIYGSEDIQLDLTKMRTAEQFVIEGGNHAYFGNYGEQEGDGRAIITRESQQEIAVIEILEFIEANKR